MDINFNKIFNSAKNSKSKFYKKIIYYFCKHYFYCDIHPFDNIGNVKFEHSALGVVINSCAKVGNGVTIQHHVTIGSNHTGLPTIGDDVYIGAYAIIIGGITIGNNCKIGAGCVVTKNVPENSTVVGNPMRIINNN